MDGMGWEMENSQIVNAGGNFLVEINGEVVVDFSPKTFVENRSWW